MRKGKPPRDDGLAGVSLFGGFAGSRGALRGGRFAPDPMAGGSPKGNRRLCRRRWHPPLRVRFFRRIGCAFSLRRLRRQLPPGGRQGGGGGADDGFKDLPFGAVGIEPEQGRDQLAPEVHGTVEQAGADQVAQLRLGIRGQEGIALAGAQPDLIDAEFPADGENGGFGSGTFARFPTGYRRRRKPNSLSEFGTGNAQGFADLFDSIIDTITSKGVSLL